jgi:hypothetical protein
MSDINDNKTCNICGKHFEYPCLLERHKNGKRKCKLKILEHNPDIKSNKINYNISNNLNSVDFECNYCKRICASKYSLERHYSVCKVLIQSDNTTNKDISLVSSNDIPNFLVNIINDYRNIINDYRYSIITNKPIDNISTNKQNNKITKPDTSFNAMLNSNNSNNTVIANTQNNISTQNTINLPTVINPFGYEDISSIPDNDKLKMLKSYNGVEMAIDRVYTIPENRCFFKSNLNKDNVAILTNGMTVQIKKMKTFMDLLIENGITIMERMFMSCKKKLSFIEQLLLLTNISANRDMIKNKSNQLAIEGIVETCFQDSVSKEHFKNFTSKLRSDENFKKDVQEQLKAILDNIDRFNADKANQTITDEFLRSTVWSKDEETSKDADSTAHYNNLALHHIETTPRYKFFKEMNQDEITYFKEHGISLGNMIAYCKILQQRNRDEIKKIEEDYKNNPINDDNRLVKELTEKLVEAPKLQMLKLLESVKFIDDNHNKETEPIEDGDSNLDYLVEEFFNEE